MVGVAQSRRDQGGSAREGRAVDVDAVIAGDE